MYMLKLIPQYIFYLFYYGNNSICSIMGITTYTKNFYVTIELVTIKLTNFESSLSSTLVMHQCNNFSSNEYVQKISDKVPSRPQLYN
jgi:hypothetical protein